MTCRQEPGFTESWTRLHTNRSRGKTQAESKICLPRQGMGETDTEMGRQKEAQEQDVRAAAPLRKVTKAI